MNKPTLFLGTFFVALIIQSLTWRNFEYIDKQMWIDESRYIQTGDAEAFNRRTAYGHPGGPPVIINMLAHSLLHTSYEHGLAGSLALLNAAAIAACATICYILRPQTLWWLAAAGTLTCSRLYPASTPPSAAISPLIVLIFLLALWLYEKASQVKGSHILILGATIGIAAATRTDITVAVAAPLMLLLAPRIGWKKITGTAVFAAIFFTLGNPFMWIMSPLQQVVDLFWQIQYHIVDYPATPIGLASVLLISPLAIMAIGIAVVMVLQRKKVPSSIPVPYLLTMIVITIGISIILLNARSQAPRYFFPFAFLWETFLPLFILELLPHIRFNFLAHAKDQAKAQQIAAMGVVSIVLLGQAILLIQLYFLPQVIFTCPPQGNRWINCTPNEEM